ncbi:MAG: hypothetical protein K0U84_14335 [Actinomycetia bacterium]|nr:hypothetical protein [Actinomycetes bacterium]
MTVHQEPSAEWNHLATVSSVAGIVASQVSDLTQLQVNELPGWLLNLGLPPGWRIAHYDPTYPSVAGTGRPAEPSRIAVCTPQTNRRRGYGCETITVFGFTGSPAGQDIYRNAECSLSDLGAADTTSTILETPAVRGAIAVRSSGYLSVGEMDMWAQYSNYIAGSDAPKRGRLVQHCLFIGSDTQHALTADIAELSDAVYQAFFAEAVTAETKPVTPRYNMVRPVSSNPTGVNSPSSVSPHHGIPITDQQPRPGRGTSMPTIRVEFAQGFYFGDDAVLLTMDGAGAAIFAATVKDARSQGTARLEHDGVTHEFLVHPGDSTVQLNDSRVVWRLSPETVEEIYQEVNVLSSIDRPGHFYVDISAPAETLVLSRDEYTNT